MIIGLTGYASAGKEEFAKYLRGKGLVSISLSDELRKIAMQMGRTWDREDLQDLGNEMREKHGTGYLAEVVKNVILNQQYRKVCVDSIRNPGEVEVLKTLSKFYLVGLNVAPEKAWELMQGRKRKGDPETFEDFMKVYNRERGIGEGENGQQVAKCMRMADFIIKNDSDLAGLEKKCENTFKKIETESRPTWDEYFMDVMESVSERATCDRGRSGCVIAKDKQILVTGYVGSPIGMPHCDDVGHKFKKVIHEDGHITNHCVRTVHAEQNAICQAAKLGVSLKNSNLYCRMTPCGTCAMLIINSGIRRVVCQSRYHSGEESEEMFRGARIRLDYVSQEVQQYAGQKVEGKK